jgi:hypothetical protein
MFSSGERQQWRFLRMTLYFLSGYRIGKGIINADFAKEGH